MKIYDCITQYRFRAIYNKNVILRNAVTKDLRTEFLLSSTGDA